MQCAAGMAMHDAEYLRLARVHGARVEVFAALESCGHHFAFGLGPLMDP